MKGRKLENYEKMMDELWNHFKGTKYEEYIIDSWIPRLRGFTYGWNYHTDGTMQEITTCDGCGRMPEYVCLNCGKSYCINHEPIDECQKKEVMRDE